MRFPTLVCRDDLMRLATEALLAVVASECTFGALVSPSARQQLLPLSDAERADLGVCPGWIYDELAFRLPLRVHGARRVPSVSWKWIVGNSAAANIASSVEWVYDTLSKSHALSDRNADMQLDLTSLSLAVTHNYSKQPPAPTEAQLKMELAAAQKAAIARIANASRQTQLDKAAAAVAAGMS